MFKDLLTCKSVSLVIALTFFCDVLEAQNWTQEASFPGGGRQYSAYFATSTKGYIGFGNNQQVDDLWEYTPASNTWVEKAPIPTGGGRAEMIGFSIGNEGYVGMGFDTTGESNEFWKFDPPSNTWTQVAPYPGAWLRGAIVFTIGTNAYVTAGYTTGGLPGLDVWEYNTTNNTWTQKSDLPDAAERYFGVGFGIGNKGYIGTGVVGSTAQDDFWEYDLASDNWTQLGNAPGGIRVNGVGFSNSTNGFIGMGEDNVSVFYHDFWEYNPASDTWTQETNYAGAGTGAGAGFAIGCSAYEGTGFSSSGVDESDFWQLPVCTSLPLTATISQTNDSCYGGNNGSATANASGGTLPYTYFWEPGGDTTQTITGLVAGTYSLTVTDSASATDTLSVTITQSAPVHVSVTDDTSICHGSSVILTASGGSTYAWSPSVGLNPTIGPAVTATPDTSTTYTVTAFLNGCTGTGSVEVSILPLAQAGVISADKDTICQGDTISLTANGNSSAVQWQSSLNGINFNSISGADSMFYFSQPAQTTYFRVFAGTGGCSDTSLSLKLVVNALPSIPMLITSDSIICSGYSTQICSSNNYANYQWNTGDSTSCTTTTQAGGYWVTVTDSNGCSAVSSHQYISVYPVSSVSITVQGDTLASFNSTSYQWFFDDSIIPGANSSVYVAHHSGNYAVQIVDTNGCRELSDYTTVTIAGISALQDNTQWNIYPNPFKNLLFIEGNYPGIELEAVEIYDVLGRLYLHKTINAISNNPLAINVNGWPNGIYIVKLETMERGFVKKMIKQ